MSDLPSRTRTSVVCERPTDFPTTFTSIWRLRRPNWKKLQENLRFQSKIKRETCSRRLFNERQKFLMRIFLIATKTIESSSAHHQKEHNCYKTQHQKVEPGILNFHEKGNRAYSRGLSISWWISCFWCWTAATDWTVGISNQSQDC